MKDMPKVFAMVLLLLVVALSAGAYLWLFAPARPGVVTDSGRANTPATPEAPRVNLPRNTDEAARPDPVVTRKPAQEIQLDAAKPLRRMLVSGRVSDPAGGILADIRVEFAGSGELSRLAGSGYTDPSGRYSMLVWERAESSRGASGATGGRVFAISPDGRVGATEAKAFELSPQVEMDELKLERSVAIEGRVTDPDGANAPFAQVTLRSHGMLRAPADPASPSNMEHRPVVRTVQANERGMFSVRDLPPGLYGLTVEQCYFGAAQAKVDVDVSDGVSRWQDVILQRLNYVRGRLLDQEGRPIEGAVVSLRAVTAIKTPEGREIRPEGAALEGPRNVREGARGELNRRSAGAQWRCVTDPQGRFGLVNLFDADYVLATALGGATAEVAGVRVNQADYTLTLNLENSLGGNVKDAETGRPVERYDVRVVPTTEKASPFDRVRADSVFPWHEAGGFRLVNVPAGSLSLRFSAPGYAPLVLPMAALGSGERRANIEVSLLPLCELRLALKQGERRLPREPVMLLFEGRVAYEASSDEFGEARLPDVAPGSYEIRVQRADGSEWRAALNVPAKTAHEQSVELAKK